MTPAGDSSDHLSGRLGQLIRRFGWLAGVYIAVGGAGITLVSTHVHTLFSGFNGTGETSFFSSPLLFSKVIIGLGVATMLTGVILAVVLYRRGRR